MTDADGNIAQHIEYIPYGEVFVEERNSQFSTNFLFNAKELDNETGLYYYGARYLDPTGAMWLSVDPMWEKYAGMSPYNYCMGNPVKMVDPDGRDFDENGEKVASQIEKKLHKISAKLDKDYHKSKIEHSEYTNRKRQIDQSLQDIKDMRSNDKITFTYAKAKSGDNGFNTREISIGKVTLRVGKDIGTRAHESRHGGDIARETLTEGNYNVDHEISAYQAQYSVTGSYSFKDLDKINNPDKNIILNNVTTLLQFEAEKQNNQTGGYKPIIAPSTEDPHKTTIRKFGDINKNMIKRITEDGRYPVYNYPSSWYNE